LEVYMIRTVLLSLFLLALPALAVAQEEPSCDYCGSAWDTRTRVHAVLANDVATEAFRFDSLWHYYEWLFHAEQDGTPYAVVSVAYEDYAASASQPSQWVLHDSGAELGAPVFVWTPATFPGARKDPFVATFADRTAAAKFAAEHGGDVLELAEVEARFKERWNKSHGPAGEEQEEEH
jgi:nitrous oxide reductase accessory protein NosL